MGEDDESRKIYKGNIYGRTKTGQTLPEVERRCRPGCQTVDFTLPSVISLCMNHLFSSSAPTLFAGQTTIHSTFGMQLFDIQFEIERARIFSADTPTGAHKKQ